MYCIKCGKETKDSQVFCDACLLVMQEHPVKPGTAVQIPNRPVPAKKQPSRRRALSPEEQAAQLQKTVRRLKWAVFSLVICLCLALAALGYTLYQQELQESIGKNYSTVTPTETK